MTTCYTVVRGKRVRVTSLDECCNVPEPEAPDSLVVSSGFVTVALASQTEDGDEFIVKNANGDLCVNERSPDQFKRWNTTITWCQVDPDIINMITGFPLELDWEGDAVGFRVTEGVLDTRWAFELWTGIGGLGCEDGDARPYGYLLVPCITGALLGDITIENGAVTFQTTGYTDPMGGWGVGPYDVVPQDADNTPGPLHEPMTSIDHLLLRTTTVAPPDAACGAQPMPAAPNGNGG